MRVVSFPFLFVISLLVGSGSNAAPCRLLYRADFTAVMDWGCEGPKPQLMPTCKGEIENLGSSPAAVLDCNETEDQHGA